MISFNSSQLSLQNSTGVILEKYITVQAATEISGYNTQYLRRLLRAEKLDSVKVGQMWLIKLESLENYTERVNRVTDRRLGPRKMLNG
ncbi:MAG: helix-turn-helix domain-containing protein [Anaerolineaceae bacterium]|nr:helix-turn-helix domain-containing protein [Anaerolineaceae bacterium]